MTQEALKLALEFIENSECGTADLEARIKKALSQPEQEPVAWMYEDMQGYIGIMRQKAKPIVARPVTPLYIHPPQRTWVGLEGEEIRNLWEEATKPDRNTMTMVTSFAKAIEAKLKDKNCVG